MLLAPRVRPHICVLALKLACMLVTIWSFAMFSICLLLVASEVIIHLPVWALALPSFMFHAPACLLGVVFLGLWGRGSLNAFLEMKREIWDPPADADANATPAQDVRRTKQEAGEQKTDANTTLTQNPDMPEQQNNTLTWPESLIYLSAIVGVVVVWVWIPMVVGAACSRMSLRMQQVMTSSSQAWYEGHVDWTNPLNWLRSFRWDPEDFAFGSDSSTPPRLLDDISRLFNIPNFFSGIWLLDVLFCLSEYGQESVLSVVTLFVRIKRQRQRQQMEYATEGARNASQMKQLMPIVWELLRLGHEVGIPAVGFLLLVECDASTGTFAATLFASVAVCALLISRACSSLTMIVDDQLGEQDVNTNAFLEFARAFHDDVRDSRYRTGVKLTDRVAKNSSESAKAGVDGDGANGVAEGSE